MSEPANEEWAEDFLSEAHDELNRAAVKGRLCNRGNDARLLIGETHTVARRHIASNGPGQWPREAIDKVKEAHRLLAAARHSAEVERAAYLCAGAERSLEESGKLKPEFARKSEDAEAPLRFFGNTRVANGGTGHGVALARPLLPSQGKSEAVAEAPQIEATEDEAGWKQRAEKLASNQGLRRGRGPAHRR